MDALAKLHHCMLKVADEVLKERNMVKKTTKKLSFLNFIQRFWLKLQDEDVTEVEGKDVDALIAMLSIEDITDHLQLTTLRPTWAVLRPCKIMINLPNIDESNNALSYCRVGHSVRQASYYRHFQAWIWTAGFD